MLLWRRRDRAPCPVCDLELPIPAEAKPGPRRCDRCGTPLIPIRAAGLGLRSLALLIDLAVLSVTALPLHLGLSRLVARPPIVRAARGWQRWLELATADLDVLLVAAAPALAMGSLYFLLFWAFQGQTLGQRAVGLRVIDPDGHPPSPLRAAVRLFAALVGGVPAGLGWWACALHFERRAWHDVLSNTRVIRQ